MNSSRSNSSSGTGGTDGFHSSTASGASTAASTTRLYAEVTTLNTHAHSTVASHIDQLSDMQSHT
jgi:hypothetical protein